MSVTISWRHPNLPIPTVKFAVFVVGILPYTHVYTGRGAIISMQAWPEQIYVYTERKQEQYINITLKLKGHMWFCWDKDYYLDMIYNDRPQFSS